LFYKPAGCMASVEVPVGIHDAPLDYVMTEQESFACA
jgi:hypothetical protein